MVLDVDDGFWCLMKISNSEWIFEQKRSARRMERTGGWAAFYTCEGSTGPMANQSSEHQSRLA